jgi:hypothetical protein
MRAYPIGEAGVEWTLERTIRMVCQRHDQLLGERGAHIVLPLHDGPYGKD